MIFIFCEFELQTGEKIVINLPMILGFGDNILYAGNNTFNVKESRLEILEIMKKTLQQASGRQGIVVPQGNIPDLGRN